jgi:hypothetical protein
MMGWREVASSNNTGFGNTSGSAQRLQLGMQYNF